MIKAFKLKGTSMRPFFYEGDFAFCKTGEEIKKGDMILYRYADVFYLHRVIGFKKDMVIVSNDDDMSIHYVGIKDVIGRTVSPYNGYTGYIIHIIIKNTRRFKRFLNEYIRKII